MDQKTKNQLDRLLADGELSRPEAEAIFDRVHAEVVREDRVRPLRAVVWGGAVAAAAVLLLLLIRPSEDGGGELSARGSAAFAPTLEVTCSDGTLSACPLSAKLVFLVSGSAQHGFLSAYAEPLDTGAERVWYFSHEAGSPQLTPASDGTHVFDRAVTIAGSHRPGRYRVRAFLAERPLAREEMLADGPLTRILSEIQSDVTVTTAE